MSVTTADLLDEYGQALRGYWGGIDGRSEKAALLKLSAAIRRYGDAGLSIAKVRELRDDLGVCLSGGGHWQEYCNEEYFECGRRDTP